MREETLKLVYATRRSLHEIDEWTTGITVVAFSLIAAAVCGFIMGSEADPGIGFAYGLGAFSSLVFSSFLMIYARRAWLLARAAFLVSSDGVEDEPLPAPPPDPDPVQPPPPEPAPDPAPAPPPDPMQAITSDARLFQLLLDLPVEKLQAIIDAKAMSK